MANIYVRSTDGNDADNGSTWALAKATLAGAKAIAAGGDNIYVSQSHAESTASYVDLTSLTGSFYGKTKIICGDDGAAPPTSVATTATVAATGGAGSLIAIASTAGAYFHGLTFDAGYFELSGELTFSSCAFVCNSTINYRTNYAATTTVLFNNCSFKFGTTGGGLSESYAGVLKIVGGSLASGTSAITRLFGSLTFISNSKVTIDGFDMSNASSSFYVAENVRSNTTITLRNCRFPTGWTGGLLTGSNIGIHAACEMFNCDSGDTNYRYMKQTNYGTISSETTLVRTGGASDGTITHSQKMITGTLSRYPEFTLSTPEIVKWNDTTGSSITATVEILHDSATALKDDEIWVEVMYLGTSGYPLGSFVNDAKASVVATAADQTTSSATWTTTGMGSPNKQKLSVTFTPQEKGFLHAVVKLAKASTTVYVDPMMTIT